jgi:hypothetical protein
MLVAVLLIHKLSEAKVGEVITGSGCTVIEAMPELTLLQDKAPPVPPLLKLA